MVQSYVQVEVRSTNEMGRYRLARSCNRAFSAQWLPGIPSPVSIAMRSPLMTAIMTYLGTITDSQVEGFDFSAKIGLSTNSSS
jgi:hypothetical protein